MPDRRTTRVQPAAPTAAVRQVRRLGADDPRGQSQRRRSNEPPPDDRPAETGGRLSPSYAEVVVDAERGQVMIRVRDAASNSLLQEFDASELERVSRQLRSYSAILARCALTRARTPA
jgi:hypothetical protein